MKSPLKVGVIGVGMWGRVHIQSVREDGRADVAWVCSRTAETVGAVREEFDIHRGTQDYRDVLADPEVDAIIISTPPHTHADIFVDALRAGKHVLLEKPMGTTREQVERIVAEAERHPKLVVLEASARFSRLGVKYVFVKELIASGKLGRVYFVHHRELKPTTYLEYNPKARWAVSRATAGGGPLLDWGTYDFSFHLGVLGDRYMLRDVRSFKINGLRTAFGGPDPDKVEQHGAAFLQFDDGLTYYYERGGGAYAELADETRIHGTRGGIRFSYLPWESNMVEYHSEDDDGNVQRQELTVDVSGHTDSPNTELVGHFMDCLEGKAEPVMSVQLAHRHLQMIWRILGDE